MLIFLTLWLPVLFGLTALVVDFGRIYYFNNELNASTQAAALAGASAMSQAGATVSSVTTAVTTYSGTSGNVNNQSNLTGDRYAVIRPIRNGVHLDQCIWTAVLRSFDFKRDSRHAAGKNAAVLLSHVRRPFGYPHSHSDGSHERFSGGALEYRGYRGFNEVDE